MKGVVEIFMKLISSSPEVVKWRYIYQNQKSYFCPFRTKVLHAKVIKAKHRKIVDVKYKEK